MEENESATDDEDNDDGYFWVGGLVEEVEKSIFCC
jgi:hypothetical protein